MAFHVLLVALGSRQQYQEMLVSHGHAHIHHTVHDEPMSRCRTASMESSLSGELDGFSDSS